jgi:hypothetical protein
MTHQPIRAIIGAGLAGLVAGFEFPGVPILEAAPRGAAPHRALLRFRTDVVSRITGVPFRRVSVRKGVWSQGAFRSPNIQLANLYARKCLDRIAGDRSIWNIDEVIRYVAPESFIEQITEQMASRITYDHPFDFGGWADGWSPAEGRIISTAPLSAALSALNEPPTLLPQLARAPIWTRRYRVHGADVHQTVYFPDHSLATYRASITGDLLIIELRAGEFSEDHELGEVTHAMGLHPESIELIDAGHQRYGKIVPLPDDERRHWLSRLTIEAGIYSLGRFATWRNVLLDDVVNDAVVIRAMARSAVATNFHALRATAGR